MQRRVLLVLGIILATGFAAWYLMPDAVVSRRRDIDEGVYLMVARLLNRGYSSSIFFFDQFWLFPKTLAQVFRWFGDSLIAARLTVFGFSLVGLIGMALLSYQIGARWAAPLAILCGAVEPIYLRQSREVVADVPGAACLIWSLIFLLVFQKRGRRLWLAVSGAWAGATLIIKPLAIGFAIAFVVLLFIRRARREADGLRFDAAGLTIDLLVFVAAGTIAAAPFVDLLHPVDEYRRTIGFHLAERNWLAPTTIERWSALLGFARRNIPWLAFAAVGIAALRPFTVAGSVVLAGELISIAILLQLPPWMNHYTLLIPVLIVFSVIGVERGVIALKQTIADLRCDRAITDSKRLLAMIFVAALLLACADLPWIVRYDRRLLHPPPGSLEAVVRHLQENTNPDDYLLSDDVIMPYLANRLVPPSAINLSFAATFKFDQTSGTRLETTVCRYSVAGIIASARYLRNPRLMSWIEANFPASTTVRADDTNRIIARIYRREEGKK